MKRILITGKNSYIGTSVKQFLIQWPNEYVVEVIGTRNDEWKTIDYSVFDVVFHVAGIAHQDTKNDQKELYYKINRDLSAAVAKKAKAESVSQFIFMSSMIVYGGSSRIDVEKEITEHTKTSPLNFYGDSKLQAEKLLLSMETDQFKVAIVRPPMIYGKGSKGNYPVLAKLAKITPIFPDINNKRSMIYIENLANFIKLMIDNEETGIFFPQNNQLVKTSELVRQISKVNGKSLLLTKMFNPLLRLFSNFNLIKKVFGNLYYSYEISSYKQEYNLYSFEETIEKTEGN